ncbi:hypothetical protein OROGR_012079 [Orobanche gracilis]
MVTNIADASTKDELYPLFREDGEVVDMNIPQDRGTGASEGFAFVRYKYEDEASEAVKMLNNKRVEVDEGELRVKFSEYGRLGEKVNKRGIEEPVYEFKGKSRSWSPRSIIVPCLDQFNNLENLDLSFSKLTSLECLKSCTNLKSLSVVHSGLKSLKGVNGLNRLTVLNAGQNSLTSMDDVKSLSSMRVLILCDNKISSVCKLDQMKELDTLVLSNNPIGSLGKSLRKLKITKVSLSACKLQGQDLGSSLKSCVTLEQLRLGGNGIKTIPHEFENLVNLKLLDLQNNSFTSLDDLKILWGLDNLRNLNLIGNPVTRGRKMERFRKTVSERAISKFEHVECYTVGARLKDYLPQFDVLQHCRCPALCVWRFQKSLQPPSTLAPLDPLDRIFTEEFAPLDPLNWTPQNLIQLSNRIAWLEHSQWCVLFGCKFFIEN